MNKFMRLRSKYIKLKNRKHVALKADVLFKDNCYFHDFGFNNQSLFVEFAGGNIVGEYCTFQGSAKVSWGKNTFCGPFCIFGCNEKIIIGSNVMIANNVSIRDTDHSFNDKRRLISDQGIVTSQVTIGDDVWLASSVQVLKGVSIGKGAVIGAGAVVTKDVPEYAVCVGVPAKVVGYRE